MYTYVGYICVLWIRAQIVPMPVKKNSCEPTVSIVIAVHNEVGRIPAKFSSLLELDYPKDKLEIVIASDGSSDGTNELLQSLPNVKAVIGQQNRGKASALNAAIAVARGEVILFTDARQAIEPSALRELVAHFADPAVGCASGELMFFGKVGQESGVSVYWRLEKAIRRLESETGSVVGATGAIYAVRRSLVPFLPEGTLLDDVYIPISVVRQGYRVVFDPVARAWDEEPSAGTQEFRRKVRTLAGNYQLIDLAPWLLSWNNPQLWRVISHKLMRLIAPYLLMVNFFAVCTVRHQNGFYLSFAFLQLVFYSVAVVGTIAGRRAPKISRAPAAFCLLNAAAVVGLIQFLRFRRSPLSMWKSDLTKGTVVFARVPGAQKAGRN